jgi:hypothetical protein
MLSTSETSTSSSEAQNLYTLNMSSEDTLAYSTNVSRIQFPTGTFAPQNPKFDGGNGRSLTESSPTSYVDTTTKKENEIEEDHSKATNGNAFKKLYRLSQQTYNHITANDWNRRSNVNSPSAAQNETGDGHIGIDLGTLPYRYTIEEKKKLIVLMSQCLVRYGCPSHRIVSVVTILLV